MEKFELPEDIVLNILLKLPLLCFLRFRCVCKAWYSLLSDPIFMYKNLTFIDSHYDDDDDDDLQLLIKHRDKITFHNYFSLISFHNLDCNNICESKRYLPFVDGIANDDSITVVGCCNGFVCLTDRSTTIFVWNPLTEETKVLPQSPHYYDRPTPDYYFDYHPFQVGFCFDANANDYKVIKIFHPDDTNTGETNAVFFYSFKSDCWKRIDLSLRFSNFFDTEDHIPVNSDGIFYHWLANVDIPVRMEDDHTVPRVILSFDMNLELFKTTEIPYTFNYWKADEFINIGFFMLKDYVTIFATPLKSYEAGAPIFEVSVLLRIGVKESWTKLITIGPLADVEKILWPWKNGSLFLQTCKGDVMVFDPFTKEIVLLPSNGISSRDIQIMTYKKANVELGAINIE